MKTNAEISFPPFRIDVANEQLWRDDQAIPLRPKTFAILRYLAENSGRLVKKEELLHAVWGETQVSEEGLRDYLREIRQALGDDADAPLFVETVRGRGYRFLPAVDAQPVQSAKVQQATSLDAQHSALMTQHSALVGRDADLARLHAWFKKALSGERQLVFVTGEPGIGKTALVEAFLADVKAHGHAPRVNCGSLDEAKRNPGGRNNIPPDCIRATMREPGREADGWFTHGQCIESHGSGEAFLPILDALGRLGRGPEGERLIEILRKHAPMWLVQLPTFIDGEELDALRRKVQGASRERMLRELAGALEASTDVGARHASPLLVLVLEDLHWSDVSTLDLLAFIARRKEPARLLIIGTYRPVEMLSDGHALKGITQELYGHQLAAELSLGVLSAADIAAYLAERFKVAGNRSEAEGCHSEPQRSAGEESHDTNDATRDSSAFGLRMTTPRNSSADVAGSPIQSLTRTLHHRTGGNPLFLVSLVNDLVARGALTQTAEGWTFQGAIDTVSIPESIRQLVARQRERLQSEKQQLLAAASVAGMEFSAAAVAAALTVDTAMVEQRCERLAERQQFLRRVGVEEWPDGTLAARYTFLHALYQQLWHERVTPTQLQHHHLQIGERKERAYGDRAGEIAAELAVHFEQGREYRRAIQYLQQAGEVAMWRSAHQETIALLTKGLELLKMLADTSERVQLEVALRIPLGGSLIATRGFAAPEVETAYARARKLCRQIGEASRLFPALRGVWQFCLIRGELQTARELAEQLLNLAQRLQNPDLLLVAHDALGETLMYLGEFVDARGHLEQSMSFYNMQRHRSQVFLYAQDYGVACLSYTARVLGFLGYPDQSLKKIHAAFVLARELAHPFTLAWALNWAAISHLYRGDMQAAQELVEEALTYSTDQGFTFWVARGTITRGWMLVEQGQAAKGLTQLQQGIAAFRATGAEILRPHFLSLLADAYGRIGKTKEGVRMLTEAFDCVDKTEERMYEVELYRLKGELTLQKQLKVQSSEFKVPSPQPLTPSTQVEAEECFLKAIDIARKQQAKMWELRATVSLARLWRQQGKRAEARRMLTEIYNWFTEGFDTVDLKEAKALLEELE